MGELVGSFVLPHPPIIIPEIGKDSLNQVEKTINAVKVVSKKIKELNPKTIIISTPHNICFSDYIYISGSEKLDGDFSKFGNRDILLEYNNDLELLNEIVIFSNRENINAGSLNKGMMNKYSIDNKLDHGALVPLYYISKELNDFNIVHISLSGLESVDIYKFGKCISKAIKNCEGNFVYVASGDLSHKVNENSSYGVSEYGEKFDTFVKSSLKNKNISDLLSIDDLFCERAAQCGLKSIIMMLGTLDNYEYDVILNSYEAPFGIGYLVASFINFKKNEKNKEIIENVDKRYLNVVKNIREKEHEFVKLARKSLEFYLNNNEYIKLPDSIDNELLNNRAGVFVSIKKYGNLRGCIGTIFPQQKSIAQEIINNAVSAGVNDYRFDKVGLDELKYLVYSVDILKKPVKIKSVSELDAKKFGIIISSGKKSGILLPNLEGVETVDQQIDVVLRKANINRGDNYNIEKFEVIRYK